MALADLTAVSNAEFWDEARKASPTFRSHTAKATAELFTERGFEALTRSDIDAVNEFFELSLRVGFQMLTASKARNPLATTGLVQVYDTPNGGFVQRIAVNSIKPVSPAYKGLSDGDSVDPFIVRKPTSDERFFGKNFDYQSFVTIQDFQVKEIFIAEYGMGAFVAGIMEGLRNGYTIQEYENTLECLSAALNSVDHPLQSTQVVEMSSWTDGAVTNAQLLEFIKSVKDVNTAMATAPQSSAFNAAGFATVVDTSDLILLTRAGIKTMIDLQLEVGAFNPDRLSLPFAVHEVQDFGGITVQWSDDSGEGDPVITNAYPVYSAIGEQIGWATTATVAATGTPDLDEEDLIYTDTNSDVLAVLIQKGAIFESAQNPYIVKSIDNPRGLYRNYWASRPNTGINFDTYYTMVVFKKPAGV